MVSKKEYFSENFTIESTDSSVDAKSIVELVEKIQSSLNNMDEDMKSILGNSAQNLAVILGVDAHVVYTVMLAGYMFRNYEHSYDLEKLYNPEF